MTQSRALSVGSATRPPQSIGGLISGARSRERAIERERHYLDLRERQGLSAAAIGERCGCTEWAAQAVIDRGRRRRRVGA